MRGLEFISPMGLRSLIASARQSKVVLGGMTELVYKIVALGGIARIVVIRETMGEAVQALQEWRSRTCDRGPTDGVYRADFRRKLISRCRRLPRIHSQSMITRLK
jgi:hypothetical protein